MSNEESKKNEPFFHQSENFSSAYFGKLPEISDGSKNPAVDAKLINNFIDLITNPDKRELRSDALDIIRKSNAQQFLVDLIKNDVYEKHRHALVMACWECGLDFSAHLIFFTNLVVNCEYLTAMEAVTVIDEMHNLTDNEQIKEALSALKSAPLTPDIKSLTSETVERLENLIK